MTYKIKHGLVLTVGWNERKGQWLAVITDGAYGINKEIVALEIELFDKEADALPWFESMKILQPWNERN